jgi:hypothetical protein
MLVLIFAGLATGLTAKAFEGTATYQMTDRKGEVMEMTFTLKDGKVRTEAERDGHTMINIMDLSKKSMTMLMPEKKLYMEHSFEGGSFKGKKGGKATFSKTGKSETIAGYKADEWLIESNGTTTHIWGTTELGQGFGQAPGGRPGEGPGWEIPAELREKGFFLLRAEGDGKRGKMEASSVKPGSVDSSLFEVPAGYQKMGGMPGLGGDGAGMTPEQKALLQKMMKKHGAGD